MGSRTVTEASSSSPRWTALAALALALRSAKASELPVDELDPEVHSLVAQLESSGAVVVQGGRVRFFHDTLYDFVLARVWAQSGEDLASFVRAGRQDLSDRSIVRQVLTYQQGIDRAAYLRSIESLLRDSQVRNHIQDVALTVLRDDPNPDQAIWRLVKALYEEGNPLVQLYFVDLLRKEVWFNLADRNGDVLVWLASADQGRAATVGFALADVQHRNPERVTKILAAMLPVDAARNAVNRILFSAQVDSSDRYFSILTEALRQGAFDDGAQFLSDSFLFPLEGRDRKPSIGDYSVLNALLDRWMELSINTGQPLNSVFKRDHSLSNYLQTCVKFHPERFLKASLEPVSNYLAKRRVTQVGRYDSDPWATMYINTAHDADDILFWSIADAMRHTAEHSPSKIEDAEKLLLPLLAMNTAKAWLYAAWMANPNRFAARASDHLRTSAGAFECGYADSPYWITRELVSAVHPALVAPARRQLEEAILAFYPEWETSKRGRRSFGNAQYQILGGISARNMGVKAKRRLAELRRKFQYDPRGPVPVEASFVPSPIAPEKTKRMNDSQWLGAMKAYSSEERRNWVKGGPHELARNLETAARDDPKRFARLATRLSSDVNEAYPSAILRALADTVQTEDADLVFAAVQAIYDLPGHPCGRWIGGPLVKLADLDLPESMLEILHWYAVNDPDPEEETWQSSDGRRTGFYGGDPLMAGMNSVRGAVAEAISALIWPNADRIAALDSALDSLVSDPISAVRAMAALTVLSVARHDFNRGVQLFRSLIDHDDVTYLATHHVERAATYFAQRRNSGAYSMIRRMLTSGDSKAHESAGRQALLLQLRFQRGQRLVDLAREVGPAGRVGLAQVASANLSYEPWTDRCAELLVDSFYDESVEVRDAAREWVRSDAAIERSSAAFVEKFVESPAFIDDPTEFLRRLDETAVVSADMMLMAVGRVLAERSDDLGDVRTALSADSILISTLLMRIYVSAPDARTRESALNMIDQLLVIPGADLRERVDALLAD